MIKRYFKLLCLFLFFVPLQLQAQIKPFEDYSKCMAGFLKVGGDTLYPAQFEEVQPVYGFQSEAKQKAWIVDFSGRKGCIDETGKWIFECEYTDLSFDYTNHLFFVKKDNQSGVFNENGEVVLPCKFNKLYLQQTGYFKYFETAHDDVDCAYDIRGKALTPECNYFRTHFLWSIDSAGMWKNYFVYNKTENGKSFFGITDETGKNVLVPSFKNVEMVFFEGQVAEDEPLFFVANDNNEWALADKNGKKLTRFFSADCELKPIQFIESGSRFVTYHHALVDLYIKDQQKTGILNLQTGAESELYDKVYPFGDYFVAYQKKEALVLDGNFNILFDISLKSNYVCSFSMYDNSVGILEKPLTSISGWDEGYRRKYLDSRKVYSQSDEVLLLQKAEWKSNKDKKEHGPPKWSYQIIQTKTGKLIDKKYDKIARAVSQDGIYLWAMNQKEEDSLFVDIYSYDGIFQRSLAFDNNQAYELKKELAYSYYSDELFDQVIWIQNDSGKFKGIHHNGKQVTDFVFDDRAEVVFSKENKKWVFAEGAEGNYFGGRIFYDSFHQPLFDGNTVNELKPIDGSKDFFLETVKFGYLLNADFEIVEDSIVNWHYEYTKGVLKLPDGSYPTCLKSDFCYLYVDGKLRLLDSSMFRNPQKINQLNDYYYKVDATGKMYVEPKKLPEKKQDFAGNLQLTLNNGTLTVTSQMTSKVVNVIKDVERFSYDQKQSVMVELTNHKQGLLNYKTGKWCVEPKYTEVKDLTASFQSDVTFFWAREEDKNDGKWFLVDVNGKILAPAVFDEPITRPSVNYNMPFKSYGKIGLINEHFKIVAQPIFDKCVFQDNIRAYFKDGKPHLVFPNGKMMEIKHSISDAYVSKNFLFLFNDSIEVISNEGTVLLPAMPLEKAMKNVLLAEYLYAPSKNKQKLPCVYNDHVFCAPTDLAMRYYSNHVFIDDIRGTMKEVKDLSTPRPWSLSYTFRIQCDVEPTWISKDLCSERVHGKCFPESAGKRQDFDGGSGYRVYHIMKDTCVQLRLEDLIKDDITSTQKLDDLIRLEIQKKQSFGLVCADMEGAIAAFKADFSVDQQYIFMRNQGLTEYLAIPIRDLKDILRHPEWFEHSNN